LEPINLADSPITHPETAWIANSVPLLLTVATILLFTLLLRGKLRAALHTYLVQRAARGRAGSETPVQTPLLWTPPITTEGRLLAFCLVAVLSVLVALSKLVPLFVALVLAGPATALLIWLLLWMQEQRYVSALDRALPAAVGRLGAQLRAGSGIQPALEKVLADMPAGPLKAEWAYIIARFGAPLLGGALATPQQVVAALAAQTPSRRHTAFLGHMEVALTQTHDVLIRRVQAAYTALHAAEQRRSQASTELSQMRYSGMAIGGAGLFMASYLALTQWPRFVAAYTGPLGLPVGIVMAVVLLAPFVGGFLLSRADELDY
jgi:Flp pilus assembly protein TadB